MQFISIICFTTEILDSFELIYIIILGHLWWCNGLQVRLAKLHEWVRGLISRPIRSALVPHRSKELCKLLSSSSSNSAITNFPDTQTHTLSNSLHPYRPFLPLRYSRLHCFHRKLLSISTGWSANTWTSVWRGP